MDTPTRSRILYLMVVLLMTFDLLTCVHSQGDIWFSLNGTTYHNNSIVFLEDIGERDNALDCISNLTTCYNQTCKTNWFFPNETRVPSRNATWDFYRTRLSRGQMVVRLNRRRGGEEGIYRCEISDSVNVTHTIYIGVYTANTSTASTPTATTPTVSTPTPSTPTPSTPTPSTSTPSTPTASTPTASMSTASTTTASTPTASTPTATASTSTPSDQATTTSVIAVIIIVVVFIMLVVIVIGVVILVALIRSKKRKQRLIISKFQNVTMENEGTEMKLKQEETTRKEGSSTADQPLHAEIEKEAPPNLPSRSDEPEDYLNSISTLTDGYSKIVPVPNDSKHILPTKAPRQVNISVSMCEEKESNPRYQDVAQHPDSPITTVMSPGNDIYTVPDTTSSHTVDSDNGTYETVYSEPIQPSLFTDTAASPSDSEDLQPYAPIYTTPTNLKQSEGVPLMVSGSNIQEIRELGMGQFGKVILAETVGLSAKDLRLSESDDDKSKSTLVAVKKLKSDASSTTKEAFEKEVNFMSRLTDRNVIHILGVCYEDTPFIMMEYMEKGDLNQYLQKFKTLSTTDSEPQGQITTSTLVHMTTQIATAMKYLASHNFVHRDLATRNCLVGPNYLVKISDFGMSRSLYDCHYYRIHGCFVLPVRWMAFECFYGKFSQKSDVWAFGVTMWEIFTLAKEQPYSDMSDKQVIEDALKGKNRKILAKPDTCPVEMYQVMLDCWRHNSERRATFEKLFQLLTSIYID